MTEILTLNLLCDILLSIVNTIFQKFIVSNYKYELINGVLSDPLLNGHLAYLHFTDVSLKSPSALYKKVVSDIPVSSEQLNLGCLKTKVFKIINEIRSGK